MLQRARAHRGRTSAYTSRFSGRLLAGEREPIAAAYYRRRYRTALLRLYCLGLVAAIGLGLVGVLLINDFTPWLVHIIRAAQGRS